MVFETIQQALTGILSIYIVKIYFTTFFDSRHTKYKSNIIWSIYFIWQLTLRWKENLPLSIIFIITFILLISIGLINYNGAKSKHILFSIWLLVIWMMSDLLLSIIFKNNKRFYPDNKISQSLFVNIITWSMLKILNRFLKGKSNVNLPAKYNIAFLLIPIGSMYVSYYMFILGRKGGYDDYIEKSLAGIILIFCMNGIIFASYMKWSQEYELRKYNTIYKKQLELYNSYIQKKEQDFLEARSVKHDIKHHYMILLQLIKNKEYSKSMFYLEEQLEYEYDFDYKICNTDNMVIDSMINSKYQITQKYNISFNADLKVPICLPFAVADITILLGNILDNAIEATKGIENPYIKVIIRYEKLVLLICVKNNYNIDNKPRVDISGNLLTNKENAINHGIGLSSVKKVADKYHGSVLIDNSGSIFSIQVSLFCKNDM